MTTSEWAAWVQAIGSIAAILSGYGLFFLQQHLHERARRRAFWGHLIMLNMLLGAVPAKTARASTLAEWGLLLTDEARSLRTYRSLLERIDLSSVGKESIWLPLGAFWGQFDQLTDQIEKELKYVREHEGSAPVPDTQRKFIDTLFMETANSAQIIKKVIF